MHLALGRKGAYSIAAVTYLAQRPGDVRHKAREIGEAIHSPVHYLPQILADLVHGGILVAEAGREGGYRLARPAEEITLLDVVEAAEGPVTDDRCQMTGEPMRPGEPCLLHEPWMHLRRTLARELASVTFDELSQRQDEIAHRTSVVHSA